MFPASIHVYLHVCVCFCVHEISCNNKIKGRREELRRFSLYKFHVCTFLLCCLDMDVNVLCLTMDVKFGKIVPNVWEIPTKCRRGYTNRKKNTIFHVSTRSHDISDKDVGSSCTSPTISSPADANKMFSASVLALSFWS